MNDPRGALAAHTRVTQLSPDHKEAHNYCGILHHRLRNLKEAQAEYDTVLALTEAEKMMWQRLRRLATLARF